jgi:hypothetical protein
MANFNSGASQRQIRDRMPRGRAGLLVFASGKRNLRSTRVNADPQARFSRTLTVDSYLDGHVYSIEIDGEIVSYTAVTADTNTTGVATKLAAKLAANPVVGGLLSISRVGAVITLTARWINVDVPMINTNARLTLGAATPSVPAQAVPYGRILFEGSAAQSEGNKRARLANAAALNQASVTLTPTVANTTVYDIRLIAPSGAAYIATYTSDGSATAQEIVEGLKAAVDAVAPFVAAGGSSTEDDATITITLPYFWRYEINGARWGTVVNVASKTADDVFAGVSLLSQAVAPDSYEADVDGYPPNSTMNLLSRLGEVFVEVDFSVSPSDPVYVELASGANQGKVFKTPSATRQLMSKLRWYEDDNGAEGITILSVL